jgi:hypothetical protein
MKRFEAEFIRLLVKGVNEKDLFYDVTSPEFGEFGLHLTVCPRLSPSMEEPRVLLFQWSAQRAGKGMKRQE